jgi:branched-chain amino acid transport system permease protein
MPDLLRKLPAGDAVLIVGVPAAFIAAEYVYSNQLLLLNMMVYVILAQGVNIVYGFSGYLPFGYVGFFGAGAYAAALSTMYLHVPGLVAVLLGGLAGLLTGLLLSPLLRLSGAYFAIASLAASEAVFYVIANPSLTSVTRGPYGVNLISAYGPQAAYLTAAIVTGLSCLAIAVLRRSRWGLSLLAVRGDAVSAEMAGLNVVALRNSAWLTAAVLAGLAGAVFAWMTSVFYPDTVFDLNISLLAIVFAVFGGIGSLAGPIVGAVLLYGLYNAIGITSPQYFQLTYGLLIVVLILFLPGGMAGLVAGLLRRRPGAARAVTGPRAMAGSRADGGSDG